MTTHTIPGELFLLLTDDAGRQDSTSYRTQALAAAAIAELALRERIALTEERSPKVQVLSTEPTDLPVLDQALGALAELEGKSLKSAIGHRTMNLPVVRGEGYAAGGAGPRPDGGCTTTGPTPDDERETALRARLAAAVEDPSRASLQDGLLLEILRALGIAHRILKDDLPGLSRRELDQRIEALEIDSPAATAVKRVADDMTAALAAATLVTTVSST